MGVGQLSKNREGGSDAERKVSMVHNLRDLSVLVAEAKQRAFEHYEPGCPKTMKRMGSKAQMVAYITKQGKR